MKKLILFLCLLTALWGAPATASETESMNWKEKIFYNLSTTWHADTYELFMPLYAWHNRLAYDREHIKRYNENPWGAGIDVSRYDSDGDWHALYAMAFVDSNHHPETMFGYAFLKNWHSQSIDGLHAGAGFTVGLTQRYEYAFIPVPLPLPMAGIGYKRVDLQAAYVPGIKNDGNVMFIWAKFRLN